MNGVYFRGIWDPSHDISPRQSKAATEYRVPFLTSLHPSRKYLTGIIVDDPLHGGLVPKHREILAVAAFVKAHLDHWFPKPNRYRDEMERFAPFDIHNATSTYFIKYAEGSWGYHLSTWPDSAVLPHHGARDETIDQVIVRANKR